MKKEAIDLSDIKDYDLDKTSSFTDLMSRSERKNRKIEKEKELLEEKNNADNDDILDMVDERKKSTKELTAELEKAKEEYNNEIKKNDISDDDLGKTQILELTRQMKFNFERTKEENTKNKKHGISVLNVIGEVNLLCIGYYIYLLVFTSYQDEKTNYLINGGIIISLVLLFGLSVVSKKGLSKFFNILNILALITFVAFNAYTLFI